MGFHNSGSEVFIPDATESENALARTTHLAIAAHQDDLEILAISAILECYRKPDRWFSGVVVTDGSGSPRAGVYERFSDEQMRAIRRTEQKNAAIIGEYSAQILLDYPSSRIKNAKDTACVSDLVAILESTKPHTVLTHNLADKHETHVATTLRVLEALRQLPKASRPKVVLGCEVWRDLDWLSEKSKVALDCSHHENLQTALVALFDSQISGGKRYDLAAMGRRRAHATFSESHATDDSVGLVYAMDLLPLLDLPASSSAEFAREKIREFEGDVIGRIGRLL